MFVLQSRISIGGARFPRVSEVEVCRSVRSLNDCARIILPPGAVYASQGAAGALRDEPARPVNAGDAVEIELAYGTEWHTEFRGHVRDIAGTTPLEIVCEDAFYRTRGREVSLTGGTARLADLLKDCGLDVAEAADMELHNFVADAEDVGRVLERLRTDCALDLFFDLDGKVHAVERNAGRGGAEAVRYEMGRNVIDVGHDSLTTFLQPYVQPGMTAELTDPAYAGRGGRFLVTGVRTVFGRGGARRTVSIEKV